MGSFAIKLPKHWIWCFEITLSLYLQDTTNDIESDHCQLHFLYPELKRSSITIKKAFSFIIAHVESKYRMRNDILGGALKISQTKSQIAKYKKRYKRKKTLPSKEIFLVTAFDDKVSKVWQSVSLKLSFVLVEDLYPNLRS